MNGPQHYKAAEILLGNLRTESASGSGTPIYTSDQQARMIAEAQAHATLALAAATYECPMQAYPEYEWANPPTHQEWCEVLE